MEEMKNYSGHRALAMTGPPSELQEKGDAKRGTKPHAPPDLDEALWALRLTLDDNMVDQGWGLPICPTTTVQQQQQQGGLGPQKHATAAKAAQEDIGFLHDAVVSLVQRLLALRDAKEDEESSSAPTHLQASTNTSTRAPAPGGAGGARAARGGGRAGRRAPGGGRGG
eukprot:260486_1